MEASFSGIRTQSVSAATFVIEIDFAVHLGSATISPENMVRREIEVSSVVHHDIICGLRPYTLLVKHTKFVQMTVLILSGQSWFEDSKK